MFMHDHMSGRQRHLNAKNLKKINICRQRETRETDEAVVAVEIAVQNQEVGVDCIEGAVINRDDRLHKRSTVLSVSGGTYVDYKADIKKEQHSVGSSSNVGSSSTVQYGQTLGSITGAGKTGTQVLLYRRHLRPAADKRGHDRDQLAYMRQTRTGSLSYPVEIVWGQAFIGKTEKMCIYRIKKGDTTEDIVDTTEYTNKIPRRYRGTVMKIDCVEGITYNLLKEWGGGTVKRECTV